VEFDPQNAAAWNNLGGVGVAELGASEDALGAWQRALEMDPASLEVVFSVDDSLQAARVRRAKSALSNATAGVNNHHFMR